MNAPIVISSRVIQTINSLPEEDRKAMAAALTGEMILGIESTSELTPLQQMVFAIIRSYVQHDTHRAMTVH